MKLSLSLLLTTLASVARADDWAVIVAGSKSYANYRHQADAMHAYQVVKKFGIPDERVITMIYDDVAQSFQNPFKGQMFNRPSGPDHDDVDVYAGCKLDYTGADVTPDNFISVLTGDTSRIPAGKPVLKSTSEDRVFINFADHGGTGIIAFPEEYLSATKLNNALKLMHENNMYKKLVFYLEACESGSMFEGILDSSLGIYATTAANGKESSWGTYCPPDDKVNGKSMNTCLGDLYSVNWMEDSEKVGSEESLDTQFNTVVDKTTKSHVQFYGDDSFKTERIGDFQGDSSSTIPGTDLRSKDSSTSTHVSSRDIPLHLAYYRYIRASSLEEKRTEVAEFKAEIARREFADEFFFELSSKFVARESPMLTGEVQKQAVARVYEGQSNTPVLCGECCEHIVNQFHKDCGGFNDYSIQYHRVVVNMCQSVGHAETAYKAVANDINSICQPKSGKTIKVDAAMA